MYLTKCKHNQWSYCWPHYICNKSSKNITNAPLSFLICEKYAQSFLVFSGLPSLHSYPFQIPFMTWSVYGGMNCKYPCLIFVCIDIKLSFLVTQATVDGGVQTALRPHPTGSSCCPHSCLPSPISSSYQPLFQP